MSGRYSTNRDRKFKCTTAAREGLMLLSPKGTVSVISSDPACKEGRCQINNNTLVTLINNVEDNVVF